MMAAQKAIAVAAAIPATRLILNKFDRNIMKTSLRMLSSATQTPVVTTRMHQRLRTPCAFHLNYAKVSPGTMSMSTSAPANEVDDSGSGEQERGIVPRRAILYVPGHDERKISKIPSVGADCVVLDCEDGVAQNKKEEARHSIVKALKEIDFGRSEPAVRINSVESGLAEDDLKVILSGDVLPSTILLPKVDSTEHMDWFAEKLAAVLKSRKDAKDLNLITYVESARGLLDLKEVCARAKELSEFNLFFHEAVVFGSDDYIASIGANRTKDSQEIMMARQQVVLNAKAFDLQAIDVVYIDYKDLTGLRKQSLEGASLGFTGKQAIHPDQIPVIHECFMPSKEKIEWAQELIQQFAKHQEEGKGAFVFRGQMIDRPLLLQAQNIVRFSKAVSS